MISGKIVYYKFDPAYIRLLHTNRKLREELNREVDINSKNEKRIHGLLRDLEYCNKTISQQDTTIVAHESEIQEFKSQVSNLRIP